MPKEVVTIHTGQAGVQMGSAVWELYCIEHGVNASGKLSDSKESNSNDRIETLFCETNGQYVPRTVFVDLEQTVLDEIRSGSYRDLFGPNSLINGIEDAANNYARGFYTIGRDKIESVMDAIRKVVNNCESVSAFQIMHSYSGGTGSGLTSLLLTKLSEAYGKKFRVSIGIFPSSTMSQSTVDPYNSLLHTHSAIEHVDCGILFDNESLYRKAINHLSCARPTYSLMNRLVSQMVTCVFLSHRYRYEGTHHIDVDELLTNLVPYPRIHFPVLSYAPIVGPDQIKHEKIDVFELTRNVFQGDSHFLDCAFENNKYLSCCLLYRGYVSPRTVYDAIAKVKCDRKISFVDWCPTGFKLGLNTIPPVGIKNLPLATPTTCLCMVSGNVGIREAWKRDRSKFDLIFNKRAFVHWFVGEGLEEGEFLESRDDIVTLENDYEEIAQDSEDNDKPMAQPPLSKSISSELTQSSIKNKRSQNSTAPMSIRDPSVTSQKAKTNSKISNKTKKSIMSSKVEEISPPMKNMVGLESTAHSDVFDSSNNAFFSNNNVRRAYCLKYEDDLEFGFEVEDPSWIDGSPVIDQRQNNLINRSSNNSQSEGNAFSGVQTMSRRIERKSSYNISVASKRDSLIQIPSKIAKLMPRQSQNRKRLTKQDVANQPHVNQTSAPRNIKRCWWRKGHTSSNNSFVNSGAMGENFNLQLDNMCSKMDYEIWDKNPSNNSNILSWKDSNPFNKSSQSTMGHLKKVVASSPENPFKCFLNTSKNEAFSSSVSSFVGNCSPSSHSSNMFQCSPFLPTAPMAQFRKTNHLSFIPHYKTKENDSNSELSLMLPPPPDEDDLRMNLTTKCDVISSSQLSGRSHCDDINKKNIFDSIPLAGPTFSNFIPTLSQSKIPERTKLSQKPNAMPIDSTQSLVFDSDIQISIKKRNLNMSPMESFDCDATPSKQPKLSFIHLMFKRFRSSKLSSEQKKMSTLSPGCSKMCTNSR